MLQRALKWALAICVGATIAAEAVGQNATPPRTEQFSGSNDQAQAATVTSKKPDIPESTWIELAITDWGPLQKAAPGTIVPLVVTQNVVVHGVTAIEVGTRLSGMIARQKQGSHWMSFDGKMQLQASDLTTAGPIPIDRRSVREALHGPKPIPDPRDSHALKVVGISTATGLAIGLLGRGPETASTRAMNGAIGASFGLFIGTVIALTPPPAIPIWGLPH